MFLRNLNDRHKTSIKMIILLPTQLHFIFQISRKSFETRHLSPIVCGRQNYHIHLAKAQGFLPWLRFWPWLSKS